MPRMIFIFLVITVVTFLVGRFSGLFWHRYLAGRSRSVRSGDELVQDPNCLTYVSKANAKTVQRDGVTHYFCGAECAAAFEAKAKKGSSF